MSPAVTAVPAGRCGPERGPGHQGAGQGAHGEHGHVGRPVTGANGHAHDEENEDDDHGRPGEKPG